MDEINRNLTDSTPLMGIAIHTEPGPNPTPD